MRQILPHKIYRCLGVCAGVFFFAFMLGGLSIQAAPIAVPFKVFNGDSDTIVYVGDYVFDADGSRISETWEYRLPNGNKVRARASVFDSSTRRPISYEDSDFNKNTKLQVSMNGDKIRVQMGNLKGNVDTDKTTDLPKGAFIWPNFAHILAQDWDKFVADKVGEMSLYAMTRQDTYGMKVVVEKEVTVGGVPSRRFSMEPTSFLVRQFAPTAKLSVSKDAPHRVMMFQGNGDLLDPQGNKLDARVVFEWPKQ